MNNESMYQVNEGELGIESNRRLMDRIESNRCVGLLMNNVGIQKLVKFTFIVLSFDMERLGNKQQKQKNERKTHIN